MPDMDALPELPAPDVPAVDPDAPAPLVEPAPPAVLPLAPLPLAPLPLAPLLEPEPMLAFARIHCPDELAPDALPLAPAVPLVPVAPALAPPRCRQPVTVTVRLLELPEV